MSLEPIVVDMEVSETALAFDVEVSEEISVAGGGGTDVSDTTAVESDVAEGKIFHKANGDRAVGTLILSSEPIKDVNLVDYDGKVLYSYTKAEFAALTALPAAPTHSGLVSNGWMYTLAQAQAQAASDGKLYVGHLYNTTDGRTRIKIRLTDGRLSPYLGLCINGSVTVDWGDGSAQSTITGSSLTTIKNTQHTYPSAGDYTIYLAVNSGTARIAGNANYGQFLWANQTASAARPKNAVYMSSIVEVNIGDNMQIGSNAFNMAYHAQISYPASGVFATDAFGFFMTLYDLPIACLPYGLTSIGNYGVNNPSVKAAQIPSTVTSLGTAVFSGCFGLSSLIIPSSVTTIGANCFQNCYGLGEIHFKPTTPPTVSASTAFANLPTDCKIYVPTGKLSAYTSATNYPSSSTYTYVEE